jgi:hypothetical protein
MQESRIDDLIDDAERLFERPSETIEEGLDVDDPALLQVRKACRLLTAAKFLVEHNGYYTVVIEASFAAIERSIQYYLLEKDFLTPEEYVDHTLVYRRGEEAGLYDAEIRDRLAALWRNNRSKTYYREGVGTADRATIMLDLAQALHQHVLQLAGSRHECLCS